MNFRSFLENDVKRQKKRSKSFPKGIIILLFLSLLYLQYGRDVTLCSSTTSICDNSYNVHLVIVANKLKITDTTKLSQRLIERYLDNDFKEIKFRNNKKGYPDKLHMTVYTNKTDKRYSRKAQFFTYTFPKANSESLYVINKEI